MMLWKGSSQQTKQKKVQKFTCYFYKNFGHMKKECPKYATWRVKKGKFLTLVYFEVNLDFLSKDTWWWVDSGVTTHISISLQGFLWR